MEKDEVKNTKRDKLGRFVELKLDEEKIKDLYVDKRKSASEIARILNTTHTTILSRLRQEEIRLRSYSEFMKEWHKKNENPSKKPEVAKKISLSKKGKTKENCDSVKRASETMKRLFNEGKLKSWSKGKTKETDERLKKSGEKISKSRKGIPNPKGSKILKKLFKEGKLNKNIGGIGKDNPMFGKKGKLNPNWNNGSSFEPYDKKFNNNIFI